MKLSDKTISVLKNFSSINQSILFKEGNKLRTISVMKNILAEATVSEDFSRDFGIYDLNQFLNGLSLHQDPELDFAQDGYVVIREGRSPSKYFFAFIASPLFLNSYSTYSIFSFIFISTSSFLGFIKSGILGRDT